MKSPPPVLSPGTAIRGGNNCRPGCKSPGNAMRKRRRGAWLTIQCRILMPLGSTRQARKSTTSPRGFSRICRSITGDGVRRDARSVLVRTHRSQIHEVPTGTPVFDWTVPREWNISRRLHQERERRARRRFSRSQAACAELQRAGARDECRWRTSSRTSSRCLTSPTSFPTAPPTTPSAGASAWRIAGSRRCRRGRTRLCIDCDARRTVI